MNDHPKSEIGHLCPTCLFGTKGHEIVVRRGIFPDHDFAEPHPCGHTERAGGCGGCDPSAIEFVITDDGEQRPFDPARDMRSSPAEEAGR